MKRWLVGIGVSIALLVGTSVAGMAAKKGGGGDGSGQCHSCSTIQRFPCIRKKCVLNDWAGNANCEVYTVLDTCHQDCRMSGDFCWGHGIFVPGQTMF